jgi:hypothetical protein
VSVPLTLSDRIKQTAVPTLPQALGSVLFSLIFLLAAQFDAFLSRLGITSTALDMTRDQIGPRIGVILRSPVASQAALLTFWATVGLVAYLICWGAYNLLIEARNEVTLNTAYTNRGHWRGPFETLSLKASSAVGLAIALWSVRYGISVWLVLSHGILTETSVTTAILAIMAVLGLALQLYVVLVFIQLTFTPWYRA